MCGITRRNKKEVNMKTLSPELTADYLEAAMIEQTINGPCISAHRNELYGKPIRSSQ